VATDTLLPAPSEPTEPRSSSRRRKPATRSGYTREPSGVRWTLRIVAVLYVVMLVAWPTYLVFARALEPGLGAALASLREPEVGHAIYLTLYVTFFAVLINTVFGLTASILLVRYDFPGKRILSTLLDVPLSISPVVVGLALVLVYNGRDGWFGPSLEKAGFQVIFASPGMIMATVFVALPLVIREVVPVLEEIGDDQEQAARSLGANWGQTFRRITLPAIKWAVVYGVVLSLARSIGEFGAVKIVSGNIAGQTMTAAQQVEDAYQNFEQGTAYALAALLALIAMACLVVVSLLRPKDDES
jgi:sulfate transport system permease protein